MPAFLVTLPNETAHVLFEGADSMVIFAATGADAIDAAQGHYSQPTGSNAMWAGATATEIVAGVSLEGYKFQVVVQDAVPPIRIEVTGNALSVSAAAEPVIDTAGATYAVDDIETLVGGTFTRAATIRVTAETGNVPDNVEVVDPGEYTILPGPTSVATTGNGDGNLVVDIIAADAHSYETYLGQMVTALNADAQIGGSLVDFSSGGAGALIFQVSSIGDALGDLILVPEFLKNGAPVAGLLSTIVDEGISGAVLTVAIPASIVIPRVTPVKGI